MKTSIHLLTLTLVVVVLQTTWAKPKPQYLFNIGVGGNFGIPLYNDITTAGSTSFVRVSLNSEVSSDVAAQEQNIIKTIFGGVNEAINSANEVGQNTARQFIENVRIASEAFLKNASDIGEALGESFKDWVHQNVANFRAVVHALITSVDQEILAVRNRLKRRALLEVEGHLEELYTSLNNLHGHVENLRVNWQHNLEHQQMILIRGWNLWVGEQLEKVATATNGNEQKVNQAENIINEFVNRYGNYITQCVDEAEEVLKAYEQQVDKAITHYAPILRSLIDEVNQCVQDSDTSSSGRRCSRRFKESLRQLRNAPANVAKLIATGASLISERFENNYCVAQTVIEFSLEKFAIERQLTVLILRQDESVNENEGGEDGAGEAGAGEAGNGNEAADGDEGANAEGATNAEESSDADDAVAVSADGETSVSSSELESDDNAAASNESNNSSESGSNANAAESNGEADAASSNDSSDSDSSE